VATILMIFLRINLPNFVQFRKCYALLRSTAVRVGGPKCMVSRSPQSLIGGHFAANSYRHYLTTKCCKNWYVNISKHKVIFINHTEKVCILLWKCH